MPNPYRQFARVPAGTKYVIEACGPFVRRSVEFPGGCKVRLPKRKALSCTCAELQKIGIVPEHPDLEAHTPPPHSHTLT